MSTQITTEKYAERLKSIYGNSLDTSRIVKTNILWD